MTTVNDHTAARMTLIKDGIAAQLHDIDPEETQEWLSSFDAMLEAGGSQRARYLMLRMLDRAKEQHIALPALTTTDYINTIPTESEPFFPGDEAIERRYRGLDPVERRDAWCTARSGRASASAATSPPTPPRPACTRSASTTSGGARTHPGGGDQVFFQGHASPGMYARAFLEGRLSEHDLDGFRQEKSHAGGGIPSYPHPRLMPDFWEFPTVSMGLGPMNAIQQARVNRLPAPPRHQGHLRPARLGVPGRRRAGRGGVARPDPHRGRSTAWTT